MQFTVQQDFNYVRHEYLGIPRVDSLATAVAMYISKGVRLVSQAAKESPRHSSCPNIHAQYTRSQHNQKQVTIALMKYNYCK